jgi:hypothetical protein
VVVAAGVTVFVPPLPGRVKLVPSVPVTATVVALVAVTVRVEESPALMEAGSALMDTVGLGDGP